MNRKVVKLALSSLLFVGTLAELAPKTAEAAGYAYSCPRICCAYYRDSDECRYYTVGYPVGNGLCYYEPCTGSGGGTAS
jgi:hypothetical protein